MATKLLDRRIRDSLEYQKFKDYIWQNPVKRFLAKTPEEDPYSSANPCFTLDSVPQRLKPISSAAWPQASMPAPPREGIQQFIGTA
jgi:hypothetical protein